MAPRKPSASSRKVSGSIPVKRTASTSKQSKAKKSDAAAVPTIQSVYVVLKKEGYPSDGFHSYSAARKSMVGVYPSEEQAYFAAMHHLIHQFESIVSEELTDLRNIAANKKLSLKQRLKRIEDEGNSPDSEVINCAVKKTQLFPAEKMDEKKFIAGLPNPLDNHRSDAEFEDSEEEKMKIPKIPFSESCFL